MSLPESRFYKKKAKNVYKQTKNSRGNFKRKKKISKNHNASYSHGTSSDLIMYAESTNGCLFVHMQLLLVYTGLKMMQISINSHRSKCLFTEYLKALT